MVDDDVIVPDSFDLLLGDLTASDRERADADIRPGQIHSVNVYCGQICTMPTRCAPRSFDRRRPVLRALGTGCIAIRREVLEAVTRPFLSVPRSTA
jgi:hypothetical protein